MYAKTSLEATIVKTKKTISPKPIAGEKNGDASEYEKLGNSIADILKTMGLRAREFVDYECILTIPKDGGPGEIEYRIIINKGCPRSAVKAESMT